MRHRRFERGPTLGPCRCPGRRGRPGRPCPLGLRRGPNPALDSGPDPAGFWLGLWQGFILPVTFVISLFTDEVSIYESLNSGNWYDFGYVLGVAAVLGSGGGGARAARR